MKLQFPIAEVARYARDYQQGMGARDRRLTEVINREVFPTYTFGRLGRLDSNSDV